MGHFLCARIEENDIFDTLVKIKWRADFGIFLLEVFAQNLQDCFWDLRICLIYVRRLFTKDCNVRTLQRAIGKLDIDIRNLKASTVATGYSFHAEISVSAGKRAAIL